MSNRVDQAMDPPEGDGESKNTVITSPHKASHATLSSNSASTTGNHGNTNVKKGSRLQHYARQEKGNHNQDGNESVERCEGQRYHTHTMDRQDGNVEHEDCMSDSDGESSIKSIDSNTSGTSRNAIMNSSSSSSPARRNVGLRGSNPSPTLAPQPSTTTHPNYHQVNQTMSRMSQPATMHSVRTSYTPPSDTRTIPPPTYNTYGTNPYHNGQKRRLNETNPPRNELHLETRGSHGPRDESRYETWTSKQLRKKCSHLKLRGLKNVKKHVMVEALYRYYQQGEQDEKNRYAEDMYKPNYPVRTTCRQEDESKIDTLDNEVRITSDDVIRLIDIMLSSDFVDRFPTELSRWQFWVDVREKYIHKLKEQDSTNSLSSYSRNTRWSSMQLWEMWKELTFSYTKTCFEFTGAGMQSAQECDYIQYCKGRPDVFYLHQRLHSRPDLLHLIKSNEYIEENQSGENLNRSTGGSPNHKRFKPSSYSNTTDGTRTSSTTSQCEPIKRSTNGIVYSEGSTENSESTGEDPSLEKSNKRTSQRIHGDELIEQKYFGLLLQNFEAIFESLHNKKILLTALRKDQSAPDHLIADLHDDIHVLSALKKDFRKKLRQTLE